MSNNENQQPPTNGMGGFSDQQTKDADAETQRTEGSNTPLGVSGVSHHQLSPNKLGHMLLVKAVEDHRKEVDNHRLSGITRSAVVQSSYGIGEVFCAPPAPFMQSMVDKTGKPTGARQDTGCIRIRPGDDLLFTEYLKSTKTWDERGRLLAAPEVLGEARGIHLIAAKSSNWGWAMREFDFLNVSYFHHLHHQALDCMATSFHEKVRFFGETHLSIEFGMAHEARQLSNDNPHVTELNQRNSVLGVGLSKHAFMRMVQSPAAGTDCPFEVVTIDGVERVRIKAADRARLGAEANVDNSLVLVDGSEFYQWLLERRRRAWRARRRRTRSGAARSRAATRSERTTQRSTTTTIDDRRAGLRTAAKRPGGVETQAALLGTGLDDTGLKRQQRHCTRQDRRRAISASHADR